MRWLLVFALILTACTKKAQKTDFDLPVAETLRINISQEPPSLDWSKSTDTTSSLIQTNIMQGLSEYDLSDPELKLRAALATEWKPNAKGDVWTLTLRKGVKWTDGVEFTAQHVVDGWERLLNPQTASQYAYFLFDVKNAKEYNKGTIKDFSVVGVKVNDQGQLVVELNQPKAYFPYLLTHHSTFPLRKDKVAKFGDKWTDPENIVTLGAYKLKIWDHDRAIVLERNDGFYGEKAKTKYVLAYMINEMSTATNLFDSGKLDILPSLPSREIPQLRERPEYREKGILGIYYYGLNTRKPPFDNVNVRKAISHAIDRKQITDLLAGGQIPLTSWIPAGMFGYESDRGVKFDLEKARKLLDEAGFEDRSKFPKIKIGFNTNEDHQRVAENVQAQLKKNLGIEVELSNEEWKVYLSTLQADTPPIYRLGWLGDYPDPDNFMNLMMGISDNNHTGWKNKKYDEIVNKAAGLTDREERRKLYSEAQKILTEDDVPVIPLFTMVGQILIAPRVQGFVMNSMSQFDLKEVSLK